MKPIAVLYATRAGHTQRIAEAVARGLHRRGLAVDLVDLVRQPGSSTPDRYAAVVVASPLHMGRYAPAVVTFVKAHRDELERVPTGFVSVSLSQAGAERPDAAPAARARYAAYVEKVNGRFLARTGWRPTQIKNVAGALAYSRYHWPLRVVMQQFARRFGGSTDTSTDHEYTDWVALDRFVAGLADDVLAAGHRKTMSPGGAERA